MTKAEVRQVIRGDRPWTDLRTIGMSIKLDGDSWTFENPPGISATIDVQDVARGFLTHLSNPIALREWAFVVEALDLDLDVENQPQAETLLNAVWDASFGNPVPADVIRTIEQLAQIDRSEV
jgi:hypothetical protein